MLTALGEHVETRTQYMLTQNREHGTRSGIDPFGPIKPFMS
jgi:hypothetical protein